MSFQNANEWRHTLFECMISRLRDPSLVHVQQAIGFWPWKQAPTPHDVALLAKHGQMVFRVILNNEIELQASVYLMAHELRIGFFIPNDSWQACHADAQRDLMIAYGDGMTAIRKDVEQSTLYDWVFSGSRLPDAHLIERSMHDPKIFSLVADAFTQILLHLYMSVINTLARHYKMPLRLRPEGDAYRRVLLSVRGELADIDVPAGAKVLHKEEDNGITTMLLGYPKEMEDKALRRELSFSHLTRRVLNRGAGEPWLWAIRD